MLELNANLLQGKYIQNPTSSGSSTQINYWENTSLKTQITSHTPGKIHQNPDLHGGPAAPTSTTCWRKDKNSNTITGESNQNPKLKNLDSSDAMALHLPNKYHVYHGIRVCTMDRGYQKLSLIPLCPSYHLQNIDTPAICNPDYMPNY
jgi:hypothetical protein